MRDRDVRVAVRRHLDAEHLGDPDTRVVEEMGLWSGSVRIDIAVINGELCGYELKSDRDTLERLPLQASIYSQVFDRIDLIVGERHLRHVAEHIPTWWGTMRATMHNEGVRVERVRECCLNPAPNPLMVARLLWREEALSILDRCGLVDGFRGKRVKMLHERLASELEYPVLAQHVRAVLKARDGWLGNSRPGDLDVLVHGDDHPML